MEVLGPRIHAIATFLEREASAGHTVFPSSKVIFRALELTPPSALKAVILGQDPYHGPGQAHGLAFSVPHGTQAPPSLLNILTELQNDLGIRRPQPTHCDLTPWAKQGVLLLNTFLTVREGSPLSHARIGWDAVTDAILSAVRHRQDGVAVVLWGNHAATKGRIFEGSHHIVVRAPHPSPLSAYRGFFGSKPFTRINEALTTLGKSPIDWRFPVEFLDEAGGNLKGSTPALFPDIP